MEQEIKWVGLSSPEFEKERKSLIYVGNRLLDIANSTDGHLGDVVGGIRTNIQIAEMQAKKISDKFNEQKRIASQFRNLSQQGEQC